MKKKKTKKTIILILMSLLLCVVHCGDQSEQAPLNIGLMEGQYAPDFTLKNLNGEEFTLSSFRNRNAVYLVFWATWCPYCIAEIPVLKEINSQFTPKGLKILSIDIAVNDPITRVRSFQEKNALPYPILYDGDNAVAREYGILGVPTSILVDIQGRIRYRSNTAPRNLEDFIDQLT
jgi:peroxiredoxin